MNLLQNEIEIFNHLSLATTSIWISKAENRQGKMHSSAILAFKSAEDAKKALRTRLIIAGSALKTEEYRDSKSSEQCKKCQEFGHSQTRCNKSVKCQLCAENHQTINHVCRFCEVKGKLCIHTQLKCSNCQGAHMADSTSCEMFLAKQSKSTDPLSMEF